MRGDLRGSEATYRLGLSHPAVSPFMRTHQVLNIAETLIELGAFDAAEAELEALGDVAFGQARHLVAVRRAQIAYWRGDFAAALPALEDDWRQNQICPATYTAMPTKKAGPDAITPPKTSLPIPAARAATTVMTAVA